MTKKQMLKRIKALENERDDYFCRWDDVCGRLRIVEKDLKQKETIFEATRVAMEKWERKYLGQLLINIRLAEKLANKEDTNEKS